MTMISQRSLLATPALLTAFGPSLGKRKRLSRSAVQCPSVMFPALREALTQGSKVCASAHTLFVFP
jgi:hypothetical protein